MAYGIIAANDPVNKIDPSGKWATIGAIVSIAMIGTLAAIALPKYFAPVNRNGNVLLAFDVSHGLLTIDPGRPDASAYSVTAFSGYGECRNNPECEMFGDDTETPGPIPRGRYSANINELSNPVFLWDYFRNWLGHWGDWRVPLKPEPGILTYGRSGFYLHGGSGEDTLGCISIGGGMFGNSTTDRVLRDLTRDSDRIVPLNVR